MTPPQTMKLALAPSTNFKASTTFGPVDQKLRRYRVLEITLDVTAADAGGTYDIYIITSDGVSTWDLCHFSQPEAAGGRLLARIYQDQPGQVIHSDGTITQEGHLATAGTDTAGSLVSGATRHGPWGHMIGYKLVAGGTITSGITFSILVGCSTA